MLIEFLFEKFPNWEDASETAIGDLQVSEVYRDFFNHLIILYLLSLRKICSIHLVFILQAWISICGKTNNAMLFGCATFE